MSNYNFYKITYTRSLLDTDSAAHIRTDCVKSPRFTHTLYKAIRSMAFYFCDENHNNCYAVIRRGDLRHPSDTAIVAIFNFTMFKWNTWIQFSDFSTDKAKFFTKWETLRKPRVWENMNK